MLFRSHLDADKAENKVFASKYGVSGFPTIKVRLSSPLSRTSDPQPSSSPLAAALLSTTPAHELRKPSSSSSTSTAGRIVSPAAVSPTSYAPSLPSILPANPTAQTGRIPSLDALASTYFSPTAVRSAILASASEVAAQLSDAQAALSAYYLKVMAKFVEDAEGAEAWIKKEGERLGKMASKRGTIAGKKLDELRMRQNVRFRFGCVKRTGADVLSGADLGRVQVCRGAGGEGRAADQGGALNASTLNRS